MIDFRIYREQRVFNRNAIALPAVRKSADEVANAIVGTDTVILARPIPCRKPVLATMGETSGLQ